MKVGFIGLGTMGKSMAANLQKAGYQLVVHDVVRDAAAPHIQNGASWADTPREVAEACDVVFTSLPRPADVEAVCFSEDGLAAGFGKGSVLVDLSTNGVEVVRGLHQRFISQEVAFLDAPVAGGPVGAQRGELAIWVGGDPEGFERVKPLLLAMGNQVSHVGPIGCGSIAKLTHNVGSITMSAVMAEIFTLGVKAGLPAEVVYESLRQGSTGRARAFDKVGSRFLRGQFEPASFQLQLVQKDAALALALAQSVSVPMRLCTLALQDITEAVNRGWGTRDSQSFMLLQQERANIPPIVISETVLKAIEARS